MLFIKNSTIVDYITIKTLAGLEDLLLNELKTFGAEELQILNRAVKCKHSKELVYKINYCSRLALKVMVPLVEFKFRSQDDYYKILHKFNWEQYLDTEKSFLIEATASNSCFKNSFYLMQRTKDAIADHFRDNTGKRPSVNKEDPDIRLFVHIFRENCTIYLDSSGESLHKRGYRTSGGKAPISEVLAAGLIMLSGWNRDSDFIDPMCGSGTIAIEAALYALNIPPGYYRKKFAFENWEDFDSSLWEQIKEEANSKQIDFEHRILASDYSKIALSAAEENIKNARMHKDIEIFENDFFNYSKKFENAIILTNPPYGERIKKEDIVYFYSKIGDTLKKNFSGASAWLISSDIEALKFIGLKPSAKIKLFNGPLECRFVKYELYKGSKKAKFQN